MAKWFRFGKSSIPTKSQLKARKKEIEKLQKELEQRQSYANLKKQELNLKKQNYELQHQKRIAFINAFKGKSKQLGQEIYKVGTSKRAKKYGKLIWKETYGHK